MDVIINADCASVPMDVTPLTSMRQVSLHLLASLGYDRLNLPLADLLRITHHLEGSWVVLSPIHWQASHNDAMIIAAGSDLQLSEQESLSWFKLLSDYLHVDGLTLYYHDASTWLLHAANKPLLNAKPVYCLFSHSLMPELAQLDSTMYWQKFFTECQMFFASQPNSSLLNGVWAWHGGTLAAKKSIPVCADETFFSMAQACSNKVTLYSPSVRLRDFQIILLNDIEILDPKHQQELSTISAHWYWLNSAYAHKNYNWFTRIWRNLTHAH
ncbi:hypothetical protein [Legionella quateirensis]|uniref:Uncharacterized protein conserved in bacteria n=1 Tax=Legionella quateirensis TaxID=45072 RepID=A0A378KUB3_9GAMM|nr:hypothetical protein [Legionella quateirensis]KTD50819.1 hypothetical protein Lqua_1046 [Legionella quateirensis]STY17936.1 Uncharacterized protein conserved in bacteria [Legionella quateirensis]